MKVGGTVVLWSEGFARNLPLTLLVLVLVPPSLVSQEQRARYLAYSEVEETVRLFAGSGLPGSDIADAAAWDKWIREQDQQVRARIDRGLEDSVSNFILYGTSYTSRPRLSDSEAALGPSGAVSEEARLRIEALALAVQSSLRSERVRIVREFLARKGIPEAETEQLLTKNLIRFVTDQRSYGQKLDKAGKSQDQMDVLFARGTLYQNRGLSIDTSLLPNFALEDTLRALAAKGVIGPGKIRRIAIIGPGLDFTDKRDGYDFYPLQTIQPFAVMEGVLRLGLGNSTDLSVTTLDLNPAVNSHVAKIAKDAAAGRPYTVQLPRDVDAGWSSASVGYWQHFGDVIGKPGKALPVPASIRGVALRAVAISSEYGARIQPSDLNVVTQTLDFADGQGFDLVVATNVLVYYDSFQQALALTSIARMLNVGGVFICNSVLPSQHDSRLEFLGRRTVAYAATGSYGDDVVVYRWR